MDARAKQRHYIVYVEVSMPLKKKMYMRLIFVSNESKVKPDGKKNFFRPFQLVEWEARAQPPSNPTPPQSLLQQASHCPILHIPPNALLFVPDAPFTTY